MVAVETARIILGAWLRGDHLEDVKQIPPAEFGDLKQVAAEIAGGETDPIRVSRKTGINLGDIAEMMNAKYEALYQVAVGQIIDERRKQWLVEHPDAKPEKIIEVVQASQRSWMTDSIEVPDLNETLIEYQDTLDARKNAKTLPTGIDALDEMTGGIYPGTLTAVGARPSTGKSAFCMQVAVKVARSGAKVLFFSLEMSDDQNMDRLILRCVNGVSQKQLRSGELSDEQWLELNSAMDTISELSGHLAFLQERDLPAIEKIVEKEKPDLIVIDQLTQLKDSTQRFPDRRLQFSHMTAELKRISMEHDVAVWLACQVNRDASGTVPTMANLKESGSIEEDADNVILLHRDKDEEEARNLMGNRVINVELAKHRAGETGSFQLKFIVQRFGFVPLEEIPPTGFYETQDGPF